MLRPTDETDTPLNGTEESVQTEDDLDYVQPVQEELLDNGYPEEEDEKE